MRSLILATLVLLTAPLTHAQNAESRAELYETESYLSEGWKPFLGLSSGFMSNGGRHDVEGLPTSIKALGSYYTEDAQWVFDIGGGLQHQFMSAGRHSTLPMLEASARYQMGMGWQLGPIMNTYLSDSARYGSANTNFTSFIGAAADKDFIWEGQLLRAGATVMTDLDIRDEQVLVLMANLQMSFGSEPETSEALVFEEDVPAPAEHLIRQAQAMPPEQKPLARFALESAELSAPDRTYLRRVASLLKLNADQFRSVTLVGHTDSSGPERLNERLSVARAESVKRYLESHGVPANKLIVAGRADREPISDEMSPNRRVEIKFTSGVPSHLDNALRSLE